MSNENYKDYRINKRKEGDTEIVEVEMIKQEKKLKFNKLTNKHYE